MSSNKEREEECPPGMKLDDGKCIPMGDTKSDTKSEDDNAGMTDDAGIKTTTTANPTEIPATDHECPPNTTWQDGKCVPTTDSAGVVGGAGTGDPDVPGKEAWLEMISKMFEKTMAGHTAYNEKLLENFKSYSQKQLENFGVKSRVTKESASFGNLKVEASSMVDNSGYQSVYAESVEKPANFLDAIKNGGTESFYSWTINPMSYLESIQKTMNYQHIVHNEGFTIPAASMPQIFSKQVYLIPGGRMKVPIRQFLDTQIITDADRFNWYKVNGFDFDDTTAEGSVPPQEAQTITKVQAIPGLVRAFQQVNYSDIENAPFDLVEAFNRAAALGAIDAEAKAVLDTAYEADVTTANTPDTFGWVNGNTGALISSDDIAGMTLTQQGIYAAKRVIDNKGGDSSPGNMVAFLDPQAIEELVNETANDFFTGSPPVGAPLHSTALGILENRLGIDIVMTNRVHHQDNTTNDTFRNILAMKGSIGLVVAADLQIEAQRRPDLSSINIGARHRILGKVIDESMTVRISTDAPDV